MVTKQSWQSQIENLIAFRWNLFQGKTNMWEPTSCSGCAVLPRVQLTCLQCTYIVLMGVKTYAGLTGCGRPRHVSYSRYSIRFTSNVWTSRPLGVLQSARRTGKAQRSAPAPPRSVCTWGFSGSSQLREALSSCSAPRRKPGQEIYSDGTTLTNTQVRAIKRYSLGCGPF